MDPDSKRLRGRTGPRRPKWTSVVRDHWTVLVFYDGWCSACREAARASAMLDWFGLIEWKSFRDPAVVEHYGLEGDRFKHRITSLSCRTGCLKDGVPTVARICGRIPAYWPLVPLLWLGSVLRVAGPVYDWVARRRRLTGSVG
ncbi:MAG: thiol-disulfide oxidoreductase DCC family protein [Sulfobacillus sp.]